jgi:cytoskeletal protein RodZ
MSTIATRIAAASAATSIALLSVGAVSGQAASPFDGKRLKSGSITAGKVRKDTLTGLQIREATLGIVPMASLAKLADVAKSAQEAAHAQTADHAKTADSAKSADTAKTADTAKSATTANTATSAKSAEDAQKLNGRDQTAFLSNNTRVVTADDPAVATGFGGNVTASCAAEEKAISGGGGWFQPGTDTPTALDAPVTASIPVVVDGALTGWRVFGLNSSGTNRFLRAYVICVPKSA